MGKLIKSTINAILLDIFRNICRGRIIYCRIYSYDILPQLFRRVLTIFPLKPHHEIEKNEQRMHIQI